MENENQFDQLLIRYLSNETNQAEEATIAEWINANEQNRQYFENLQNVWHLMSVKNGVDKIDIDFEWARFKAAASSQLTTATANPENDVDDNAFEEIRPAKRPLVYRMLVATAIAASVLVVLGVSWMLLNKKKETRPAVVQIDAGKTDTVTATVRHETNSSGKIKRIELQDGTSVLLFDNSELTYDEPFTGNKRAITLTGKAVFKVAKDAARPFTVFSGDISTTALGTEFSVTNFTNAKNIIVKLYEGKVVISSVYAAKGKLAKDYYLLPGQELVYNQNNYTAVLRKFTSGKNGSADNNAGYDLAADNPTFPKNEKGSWYMFNNQSLEQVFNQLQDLYNIKIEYSKSDVHNKYFIGKFDKTDSLERILRQIAALNNLKVVKEPNKFIVRK